MDRPLDILHAAYRDRYAAARARKTAGEKVVGYFLNSVPEEIILAAGMFPVRLAGNPSWRSALAERYMEEYFDGEVRSIFGALLEGRYDFVDLIVIPRNSEVYLQLYYFLLEIPRWEPQARIPPVYLFDLLQTPSWTSTRYVVGRVHALAQRLTESGGKAIDNNGLSAAIAATNTSRRLLTRASTLWQSDIPSLTGTDALAVISAASAMPHADHDAALRTLCDNPPPKLADRAPRLLIKGSPQADARFTSLVEGAGGAVVAHDHLWGDRIYETQIDESIDPWFAIARHYGREIPSPREYPQANADEHFLALVRRANVQGVIFYHDEWDDTLGWEYPVQKKLLDNLGIASLFMKRQMYFEPPTQTQRTAVRDFVESIGQPA